MGPNYSRTNDMVVLEHPTAGKIIVFGAEQAGDHVGVELSSGHVDWTYSSKWNQPRLVTLEAGLIISNLGLL